jgi:hypothetical protein
VFIESGEKPKYSVMGNYCSQMLMGAKWWRYIGRRRGGGVYRGLAVYIPCNLLHFFGQNLITPACEFSLTASPVSACKI